MSVLSQFDLKGRVAIITGGTKGLGKAIAEAYVEAGAHVAVCSRTPDACREVAEELSDLGGRRCLGLPADITRESEVHDLVASTLEVFGRLDILVNNAGVNVRHPVEDFPVDEFQKIIDTNVRGVWLCCREVTRHLKKQGQGSVINLSSALGLVGLAERTAYCSSKAAVIGMTKTLALEWAPFNVRCNAICPGPFLTEMNQVVADDPEKSRHLIGLTAMNRWGKLHEIQGTAVFLASDASTYVTGSTVSVDGGWTAG